MLGGGGGGGRGEVVRMENEWVSEVYSSALVLEEDVSGHPVIDEQRYDRVTRLLFISLYFLYFLDD